MAPREPLSVSHPRRGRHQGSERLRRVTPVMRYRDPSGGIHALTAASSAPCATPALRGGNDPKDAVVARRRDSSSITVVRAKVEVTVGTGHDVAEAAELSVEQTFLRDDPARVGGQSRRCVPRRRRRRDCSRTEECVGLDRTRYRMAQWWTSRTRLAAAFPKQLPTPGCSASHNWLPTESH